MDDEVDTLANILLSPSQGEKTRRQEAAKKLSSHFLDVRAFNALYSICCYPDMPAIEEGLLPPAGQAIGKIISQRDRRKDPMEHHPIAPKYFDAFHPEALQAALSVLTKEQVAKVYEYTVSHPLCSETLSLHFYPEACDKAMSMQEADPQQAAIHAKYASLLFKRVKKEIRNAYLHFKDIVMNIIAEEPEITILPLFLNLIKNYRNFDPPLTDFEKYAYFHVMLISKLACSDYSKIQPLFSRLKEWIVKNLPEDEVYIRVLELIVRGDLQEAYRSAKKIRVWQKSQKKEKLLSDFYHTWYLAVNWLIKERLF